MKKIFIEARSSNTVKLESADKLPKQIALLATVQYLGSLPAIKKKLEDEGKTVILLKPTHSKYDGQLLGCGIQKYKEKFDAFLFVGDGMFHPTALMLKNSKPVFILNPSSGQVRELDATHAEKIRQRVKAAYAKFLSAENIGVIVSTKPGQAKSAYSLEKKYPQKKFYYIVFDTIDFSQLENFSFCDMFVNTACPRIGYDDSLRLEKKIINIEDI